MSKAWLPQSDMYQKLQNWRIQISNLIILLKKSKGCAKKTENVSANGAKITEMSKILRTIDDTISDAPDQELARCVRERGLLNWDMMSGFGNWTLWPTAGMASRTTRNWSLWLPPVPRKGVKCALSSQKICGARASKTTKSYDGRCLQRTTFKAIGVLIPVGTAKGLVTISDLMQVIEKRILRKADHYSIRS